MPEGAVTTLDGVQMQLYGRRVCKAGAVAGLKDIKNPLARHVMEDTPHVLLIGEGASAFAAGGIEVENSFLH